MRLIRAPVVIVEKLFHLFKALQLGVFAGWCAAHGGGALVPARDASGVAAVAVAAMVAGQLLNAAVFYRLGRVGAFFGDRLGYEVPWCAAFLFSPVNAVPPRRLASRPALETG